MYRIVWTKKAVSQLQKLPHTITKRLIQAVDQLEESELSGKIKKLAGYPYYRLRVGDYRIILDFQKEQLLILVLELGHRKNIYKK